MEENKNVQEVKEINMAEEEINLLEIFMRLWEKKSFVIKVVAIFIVLGLLVALFSPTVYTAKTVVVPQSAQKNMGGSLGGIASLMGINLGAGAMNGELLSPKVYKNVVANANLKRELMNTKVYFASLGKEVSLLEYYTNKEYQKFSLFGVIKKYTIGLPGLILGNKNEKEETLSLQNSLGESFIKLSKDEEECYRILDLQTTLAVNEKDGYVTLEASMPEPLAAATVVEAYTRLLSKYVSEFKMEKAQSNYDFLKQRHEEAKANYEQKHELYAAFRDANRTLSTAVSQIRAEQIKNDYDLAFSLFSEISKQLVQAEIALKEDTPVFTVIEPVVIPSQRSKPRRVMILFAFTFLGCIAAAGSVLGLDYLKENTDIKYLQKWN